MQINDLKEGDILLFSAEKGSFISWAITFLTNAPVSHAAMYYNANNQSIIEETPPQVAINDAAKRFKERIIYVQRLDTNLPLQPVIDKATNYLNNAEPYDKYGLYIVGLLLIYKKVSLNTRAQKVVIRILKKLTASITNYIHEHKTPGKTPMVCSQFVAQCFADAGANYQLKFKNSVLQANDSSSLLEQAIKQLEVTSDYIFDTNNAIATTIKEDAETLCKELKEALEFNEQELANTGEDSTTSTSINNQLTDAIASFSLAHTETDNVLEAMKTFENQLSMYVFPGDLLLHCTNTKKVGEIKI
ncbi:hypothetical protein [Entomomonas asaccharolytica]|uniref:Uncharacterized protein n=1 Tax=Entomomonas asaccharolytica TaxID=2785331 RepID=A0A974NGB8_9GAMM|nr:hypothetical protein [Entomomonas asaccharolytica]QQP86143.1 hypothetical protein JHT90_02505 [Entomomonas asaccharolytica]